jgi:peptidyl-prolyl cis-trans isomerase B (cyclophilin B)
VASFVWLVQHHYYDKTPCHRLVTEGIYVLQCGDPLGTGAGGPGYTIPDEATGAEAYPAGTIAMGRIPNQAHSGGSQFFIVYKDSPSLQQGLNTQQYTVFGQVSAGLDVVTKVAAGGANPANDGKPKLPITLTSLTVR